MLITELKPQSAPAKGSTKISRLTLKQGVSQDLSLDVLFSSGLGDKGETVAKWVCAIPPSSMVLQSQSLYVADSDFLGSSLSERMAVYDHGEE